MNLKEIKEILASHKKWLNDEKDGHRADLSGADLCFANLREADLRFADLSFADLSEANLSEANLRFADLRFADLRHAFLPRCLKLFKSGKWTAIVMPDEILIGCQRHSVARWREFSDEEIARMHPNALKWWKENKSLVMAIHASLEVS